MRLAWPPRPIVASDSASERHAACRRAHGQAEERYLGTRGPARSCAHLTEVAEAAARPRDRREFRPIDQRGRAPQGLASYAARAHAKADAPRPRLRGLPG